MPEEFETIVEFSYNKKQNRLVVRFLDGKSYSLDIINLPKKLQTKKPEWENIYLSPNRNSLQFVASKDLREIPSFIIHSKGKDL